MDKVKKFFSHYGFWVVSALTVVVAIVGFALARSTIGKLYADQATKLDGLYQNISTIKGEVATHPNEFSHVQMQALIDKMQEDVKQAWETQYVRQARMLVWPDEALGYRAMTVKLNQFRPAELLKFPIERDPLTTGNQDSYARYFHEQFPRLAEIIGCKWVGRKPSELGGGMGGGMGMPGGDMGSMGMSSGMPGMDMGMGMGMGGVDGGGGYGMGGMPGDIGGMGGMYGMGMGVAGFAMLPRDLVIWPQPVQDTLMRELQLWNGPRPTTHDILYTQENIWILEGLLNIIKNVNGDAQENFEAPIKRIDFLRIGRPAGGRAGVIESVMGMGMGGMYGDGMGGMGMDGMGGMGMGMEGSMDGGMGMDSGMGMDGGMGMDTGFMAGAEGDMGAGMGAEGADYSGFGMMPMVMDPAGGRYVDSDYKPIMAEDLRAKMESASPEDAYYAVAKRVPVRMRFLMDQRKIQTLLSECGNADLMFEPRQVRLGQTTPAAVGSSMSFGGMMGGGMMDGGMGMPGSDMPGMGAEGGYGGGYDAMSGMGMDGGMGMPGSDMGMGMGGMGMGMGGMGMMPGASPMDIPVEIYGVVYLFNPPNMIKLGLDKVTAETELDDTVEQPAAPPTAGQPAAAPPAAGQPGTAPPAAGQPSANPQPNGPGLQPGAPATPANMNPGSPQPQSPVAPGAARTRPAQPTLPAQPTKNGSPMPGNVPGGNAAPAATQ